MGLDPGASSIKPRAGGGPKLLSYPGCPSTTYLSINSLTIIVKNSYQLNTIENMTSQTKSPHLHNKFDTVF